MKRALLLLLAVSCFATVSRSQSDAAGLSKSPNIISYFQLVGSPSLLQSKVLFTPSADGLFRVSTYVETITASNNDYSLCGFVNWTDDSANSQPEKASLSTCIDTGGGSFYAGQGVTIIRAKGGTPVTIDTTLSGPAPGFSYSIFVVVEQF
jgi:hypothetical protein